MVGEWAEYLNRFTHQKMCMRPTYAPVCDSPASGLVLVLASELRGVANTENVPFALLRT
jgi:hypothetical protein